LLLSFFDLVVLWLIWKEYQIQRRAPAPHASAAARRPS
jgi:hypothetical protein